VNVRLESITSEPALLPVWIMAYQYRDQTHRSLINGQTGRATGEAPVSAAKIAGAIAIAVIAAIVLMLIFLAMR
jgi:hypothetical protein